MRTRRVAFVVLAGFVFGLCSGPSAESSRTLRRYDRAKAGYDEKALEAGASFVQLESLNASSQDEVKAARKAIEVAVGKFTQTHCIKHGRCGEKGKGVICAEGYCCSAWSWCHPESTYECKIEQRPQIEYSGRNCPENETRKEYDAAIVAFEKAQQRAKEAAKKEDLEAEKEDDTAGAPIDLEKARANEEATRKALDAATAEFADKQCTGVRYGRCGSQGGNRICGEKHCCSKWGSCWPKDNKENCDIDKKFQLKFGWTHCLEDEAKQEYGHAMKAWKKAKKVLEKVEAARRERSLPPDYGANFTSEQWQAEVEKYREAIDVAVGKFTENQCIKDGQCGKEGKGTFCAEGHCCSASSWCLPESTYECKIEQRPQIEYSGRNCPENEARKDYDAAIAAFEKTQQRAKEAAKKEDLEAEKEDDTAGAPIDLEKARANEEATRKARDAATAEFADKQCTGVRYGRCGSQGDNRICGEKHCCSQWGSCWPKDNKENCDIDKNFQLKFGWTHCLEDRAKREENRALKAWKKAKKILEKAESQSGTPNISTSDGDGLDVSILNKRIMK